MLMSTEPQIKFSNEESKANIRYKIAQNLLNIIDLTKSTIKSSESNELFKNSFKKFIQNEHFIESSGDKLKKIEIISSQLNFQVNKIKSDLELLQEVSSQIESIKHKHV